MDFAAAEHGLARLAPLPTSFITARRTETYRSSALPNVALSTAYGAFGRLQATVVSRQAERLATHLALVRGPISRGHARRWCACTSRLSVTGPARRGKRVAFVVHFKEALARDRRGRAAASSCCSTATNRPESRCSGSSRQRAEVADTGTCRETSVERNDRPAQLTASGRRFCVTSNVGRMRLLAKPRKMPSMTGYDLTVVGYVEHP